jgi:hypothetical protein
MLFDDMLANAQAVYASLKQQARERFPVGHHYAMAGGRVVADNATVTGVRQRVRELGLSNNEMMNGCVHGDVPECDVFPGWIMYMAMSEHLIRVMTPEVIGEQ